MKKSLHIAVIESHSEILNSREAATMLLDLVKEQKADSVEIDFNSVKFMSRSFADQFYKERLDLEKRLDMVIEISNANEDIIKMLRIVARTQNKTKRNYSKLPVFNFSNSEMLSDYLLSV